MIFEKQCKFNIDQLRPTSPTLEKSEAEVSNEISTSPPKTTTENDPIKATPSAEVDPSESQPSKRAKLCESSTESS